MSNVKCESGACSLEDSGEYRNADFDQAEAKAAREAANKRPEIPFSEGFIDFSKQQ